MPCQLPIDNPRCRGHQSMADIAQIARDKFAHDSLMSADARFGRATSSGPKKNLAVRRYGKLISLRARAGVVCGDAANSQALQTCDIVFLRMFLRRDFPGPC